MVRLCPRCETDLTRSEYEGLPVFSCQTCNGQLISVARVENVKQRRIKSKAELEKEAERNARTEQQTPVRCPRCKGVMDKSQFSGRVIFDQCSHCQVVWFDGGELAQLQLQFESSEIGIDKLRLQNRHLEMTDEEKERFAARLAKMPEGDTSFLKPISEGFFESAFLCYFRWLFGR